ncbi:MAG: radical SAM protein, partial [Erysipelotrichaceae bacterium]|nr:radical SAM protein [Erysipelotrichaceae bacterium]
MPAKNISVMIKPASSLCNLRCRYCFYADISENREIASSGIMSEETCDTVIARIAEALGERGTANISFQGGEPTVAGLPYFVHFTEKMKEYPGIKVNYALQTNGTLIDEDW